MPSVDVQMGGVNSCLSHDLNDGNLELCDINRDLAPIEFAVRVVSRVNH